MPVLLRLPAGRWRSPGARRTSRSCDMACGRHQCHRFWPCESSCSCSSSCPRRRRRLLQLRALSARWATWYRGRCQRYRCQQQCRRPSTRCQRLWTFVCWQFRRRSHCWRSSSGGRGCGVCSSVPLRLAARQSRLSASTRREGQHKRLVSCCYMLPGSPRYPTARPSPLPPCLLPHTSCFIKSASKFPTHVDFAL